MCSPRTALISLHRMPFHEVDGRCGLGSMRRPGWDRHRDDQSDEPIATHAAELRCSGTVSECRCSLSPWPSRRAPDRSARARALRSVSLTVQGGFDLLPGKTMYAKCPRGMPEPFLGLTFDPPRFSARRIETSPRSASRGPASATMNGLSLPVSRFKAMPRSPKLPVPGVWKNAPGNTM